MVNIGITGGIGSGKSTVTNMLAQKGAKVIDADQLAKEALYPGTEVYEQVLATFGNTILDETGKLSRARIAKLVFTDETKIQAINNLVHPYVHARRQQIVNIYIAEDVHTVIIQDIPIIVENDLMGEFAGVICVYAPLEQRVQRLLQRGISETEILYRMANQASDEARLAAALWIINNDSTIAHLQTQVDHLWPALQVAKPFVDTTVWWTEK